MVNPTHNPLHTCCAVANARGAMGGLWHHAGVAVAGLVQYTVPPL